MLIDIKVHVMTFGGWGAARKPSGSWCDYGRQQGEREIRQKFRAGMGAGGDRWSFGGGARAETQYSITALGTLGRSSEAAAINSSGQIAGSSDTGVTSHAFLYSAGSMIDLGTLGGRSSGAHDLNDSGQVVGWADIYGVGGVFHAFLYDGGTMTDLANIPNKFSLATGINNKGQVVGSIGGNAFLYQGGSRSYVPTNYSSSSAAINDNGDLLGTEVQGFVVYEDDGFGGQFPVDYYSYNIPYVYKNGVVTNIYALAGASTFVMNMNDSGSIVGQSDSSHAFLYANGTMTDLGTLGGYSSNAQGINNFGHIVGSSSVPGYGPPHGFLYQSGVMMDLNGLIDPALGWTITTAADINDHGQIAATGCNATLGCQALRLDPLGLTAPVPEPETYVMFLAGLGVLGAAVRRGKKADSTARRA